MCVCVLRGDAGVTVGVFGAGHHTAGFRVKLSIRTVWTILVWWRRQGERKFRSAEYSQDFYPIPCLIPSFTDSLLICILYSKKTNIKWNNQTQMPSVLLTYSHPACPVWPSLSALEPRPVGSCAVWTSLFDSPGRQSGCWRLTQENMTTS